MHNAPSVIYPVGRCRFHAWMLLLLALPGLMVLVAWWTTLTHPGLAGMTGALLWLGWMVWAAWSWLRSPVGLLRWDALAPATSLTGGHGAWRWHAEASFQAMDLQGVELAVDLQSLALLRLHGASAGTRWLWVARRQDPARWSDLRRALQSTKV